MSDASINKIENVLIQINKAVESSGNQQFFIRATRIDSTEFLGTLLEYQCFQTKSGLTVKECIDNALFSASFLLRFFGHKAKDLKFIGFNEAEMQLVQESKRFWRIN